MADTADRILADLRRRRDEIKPLVGELERIEAAIDALEAAGERPPARAGANGDSGSSAARGSGSRRGRPRKGEPNRTDQFLALVREGGTSIPAAAKELGIGPNYLYRIAGSLESEGTIRKQGRDFVMNVDGESSDNADVLSEPGEPAARDEKPQDDRDLVADEGVNEGTREIVEK